MQVLVGPKMPFVLRGKFMIQIHNNNDGSTVRPNSDIKTKSGMRNFLNGLADAAGQ